MSESFRFANTRPPHPPGTARYSARYLIPEMRSCKIRPPAFGAALLNFRDRIRRRFEAQAVSMER